MFFLYYLAVIVKYKKVSIAILAVLSLLGAFKYYGYTNYKDGFNKGSMECNIKQIESSQKARKDLEAITNEVEKMFPDSIDSQLRDFGIMRQNDDR